MSLPIVKSVAIPLKLFFFIASQVRVRKFMRVCVKTFGCVGFARTHPPLCIHDTVFYIDYFDIFIYH